MSLISVCSSNQESYDSRRHESCQPYGAVSVPLAVTMNCYCIEKRCMKIPLLCCNCMKLHFFKQSKQRCLQVSDWCCITACFIIFSSCLSMGMTPWRPFMRLLFLFTTTSPRTRTASEFPWQHAASPPAHHNLIPASLVSQCGVMDVEISSQIQSYHVLQPEETS